MGGYEQIFKEQTIHEFLTNQASHFFTQNDLLKLVIQHSEYCLRIFQLHLSMAASTYTIFLIKLMKPQTINT